MNRKQRRAAERELKKQHGVEEELAEKMMLFSKLPQECSACTEPFDKQDREMVMSWNVVVREKEEIVRLYCPSCWNKAQEALAEIYGGNDEVV
tara:strand:+ start:330 stop:608 length:279 start_codon:yes stop_codon:yes gene_type:complete